VSVEGRNAEPRIYLERLGAEIGTTVLFDPLPSERLTINAENVAPQTVIEIIIRRFPTYELEVASDYFYVRRIPTGSAAEREEVPPSEWITRDGELYGLAIENTRSSEAVAQLFQEAEEEYVTFAQSDSILSRINLSPRPFDETLRYLLDQAGLDYTVVDGLYVLMELQRRDVVRRYLDVEIVSLRHLSVSDLPNLLPPDFSGSDLYRLDQSANRIILAGTREEIAPLLDFIGEIDQEVPGQEYRRYDVEHLAVADLISVLPRRLSAQNPRVVPHANSFVVQVTPDLAVQFEQFIATVDVAQISEPIRLRFIRAQDLLVHLPPSVTEENIVQTQDSTLIFYRGSEEGRAAFLRELELIDQPVPQIRYQLLVVQYHERHGLEWGFGLEAESTQSGSQVQTAILGTLGQLLDLSFDIISTFGLEFALNLSAELRDNNAQVMADTTLNGLSGEDIRFQNTNTFRYRELGTDSDTGQTQATGVTAEVTSGLIISINGWTSGDGMITMDVSATVSNRTTEAGAQAGDPPPTSERVVNTHVRTESGTPVVIGGLLQQNTDDGGFRTPLLSQIPLLGLLFQSRDSNVENTELVIYIIPHLETPVQETMVAERRIEEMYDRLVMPLWERE
jgi:general secretion pathway protein D